MFETLESCVATYPPPQASRSDGYSGGYVATQ